MAKEKKGFLPRAEIFIVLIFFASFTIWAVSKCNATKLMMQIKDPIDSTIIAVTTPNVPTVDSATNTTNVASTDKPSESVTPTQPTTTNQTSRTIIKNVPRTRLFVTIDSLNMRTGPHLDSTILVQLPIHEALYFLDEVTPYRQKINMGTYYAEEPWVKVKHERGYVGWVYGAGVNYYRVYKSTTLPE